MNVVTIKLNYKQAKILRESLAMAIRAIDCIEQEEKYEQLSEMYEEISELEDILEEEEDN